MKKNSTWNLLNQLDRLPIEETEESRQLQDKITGLFLQALATCAILLFAIFGMSLLPQAYLLDVIAGCLAIVIGFRFFLEYRYGTVFTSYAQMIGKDQKKITRKKEQALFLTILCPTLLCHIAFRSVFGTGTLRISAKVDKTPEIRLANIARPREIRTLLSELVEESRHRRNVVGKEFYSGSRYPGNDSDEDNDDISDDEL